MNKWCIGLVAVVIFGVVGGIVLNREKPPSSADTVKTEEALEESQSTNTPICSEFSGEFMSGVVGSKIIKTEEKSGGGTSTCEYYFDERHFVSLTRANLSVETQKKGAEALDREIETNKSISGDHFLTVQEDGNINAIYLVLGERQYVRVDRSSGSEVTNEMLIQIASSVSQQL